MLTSIRVLDRPHQFDRPAVEHRLEATVGRQAHLLGYDLDLSEAHPGGQLPLTLTWLAGGPMVRPFKVFTHLIDAENRIWAQHDALPGGGYCPANTWAEGEVIVDPHPIALGADLPAGVYQLVVGMYDEETGARMPAYDDAGNPLIQDRITIGELVIEAVMGEIPATAIPRPVFDFDYVVYLPLVTNGRAPR
jgi:hypothetical protein